MRRREVVCSGEAVHSLTWSRSCSAPSRLWKPLAVVPIALAGSSEHTRPPPRSLHAYVKEESATQAKTGKARQGKARQVELQLTEPQHHKHTSLLSLEHRLVRISFHVGHRKVLVVEHHSASAKVSRHRSVRCVSVRCEECAPCSFLCEGREVYTHLRRW
jgi:hypothetical protein